ncbi:MAG: DUF1223 domain-containing protein [Xanthobacteraceae bacterium]
MLIPAHKFVRCGCLGVALTACGLGSAAAAPANGVAGVIELFTSQGCSSCPPADRLLTKIAHDPSMLALSFPISYWDFIGWKDTLALPEFTVRQKAYAAALGERRVYTPEAIIDGLVDAVGSDKAAIERAIKTAKQRMGALSVPVQLHEQGGVLQIDIGAGNKTPAGVYVLRVAKSRTVVIERGENSGHSVTYTNVVRAIHKVGEWDGKPESLKLTELKGDDEAYVVLVQQGSQDNPGAILAAAKGVGL